MPALHTITLEGFKSLRRIDRLALGAVNVLIGANGSGKSNFIGAFSFLHALREGRLQEYVGRAGGADRVLHFGAKTTSALRFEVSFEGGTNGYGVRLIPTEDDRLFIAGEWVSFWDRRKYPDGRPYRDTLASSGVEAGISSPVAGVGRYVRDRVCLSC